MSGCLHAVAWCEERQVRGLRPSTCPTCGSDDPTIDAPGPSGMNTDAYCPDPWHNEEAP